MATEKKSNKELTDDEFYPLVKPENLLLIFKFVKVLVDCNPKTYDEETAKKILQAVDFLCKEILIDYSYVDYEGTKYLKTFLTEKGWNLICQALNITLFGTRCCKSDNNIINNAYSIFIIEYLYLALEDLGYDVADICIEVPEDTKYIVEVKSQHFIDNYPGKWQTW